jgi:hypothetical protein
MAVAKRARTQTVMVLVGQDHGQQWPLERKLTLYLVEKYDGDDRRITLGEGMSN